MYFTPALAVYNRQKERNNTVWELYMRLEQAEILGGSTRRSAVEAQCKEMQLQHN